MKSNSLIYFNNVNIFDKNNGVPLLHITEEDFQKIIRLHESILTDLPHLIFFIDINNNIILTNNVAKIFFNIDSNISTNLSALLDSNSINLINNEKKIDSNFKLKLLQSYFNDQVLYFSLSGFPVSEINSFKGYFLILEDITEQEKIHQRLLFSEKKFSVDILIAGVAHEINNPLEILMNNLEFIMHNPSKEELKDVVEEMKAEINDIRKIIGNLINFTANNSFDNNINKLININTTILHLIKLVKFSAEMKKVNLVFDAEEEFYAPMDQTKLRLILINMIKNSFDSIKQKNTDMGIIKIQLKSLPESSVDSSPSFLLVFEDNGTGIPQDELKNIFLPFYTKKQSTGTNMGLGLALTYQTIEEISGSIEVENVQAGGLRFIITLPHHRKTNLRI